MSLSQHPDFDEALKQYYQILRCRQTQIISIIKETSELVESLDTDPADPGFDKNSDRKIKLAFNLINALANLLDEQMNALDIWERILSVGQLSLPQASRTENNPRNDFQLSVN
jgi:hypothetical protein